MGNQDTHNESMKRILQTRASLLAKEEKKERAAHVASMLVFKVGAEKYAIEYQYITRVIVAPALTPLPFASDIWGGIVYHSGHIWPVLSGPALFHQPQKQNTCNLILCEEGQKKIALSVEEIEGDQSFDDHIKLTQFNTETARATKIIAGIYNADIALIRVSALFDLMKELKQKN